MGLAGERADQLEIGIVVPDDQLASLSHRRDQGVDEGERAMPTALGESPLEADRPLVVAVGDRHDVEGIEPAHYRLVIRRASGAETEFEDHRSAKGYAPLSHEGRGGCGDRGLREAGEDARVGEVRGPGH